MVHLAVAAALGAQSHCGDALLRRQDGRAMDVWRIEGASHLFFVSFRFVSFCCAVAACSGPLLQSGSIASEALHKGNCHCSCKPVAVQPQLTASTGDRCAVFIQETHGDNAL